MSNSQSYYAEYPATRRYHDDWEDGDHCDSVNVERRRGAGDGIGMEPPRGLLLARHGVYTTKSIPTFVLSSSLVEALGKVYVGTKNIKAS